MVKTAVNLKSLWICNCIMMKKVIVMEEFQEQMVFQHLEELYLQNLPELAGFCSCNLLKFPSLSSLEIDNCPQLRRFILNSNGENDVVDTEADMTESILFDEKVAFPNLSDLLIYNMAKLKKIWHTDLHESSFCKLNRLIVSDADELLKIFPSSYAQTRLQNLECIEVVDCKSLEEVFDTQSLINKNESDAITTQLMKMHMIGLPNLRHIWSKEILDILSFQNIRIVIASGCPNLKSLFPVSLAKELRELQRLFVYDGGMVEIISKDKEEEVEERFQFPQLTNLYLHKLPELKKFYSGRHTVECPALKDLHVNCENVEIFMSEQGYLEVQSKPNLNSQPTVGIMITEESTTSSVPAGEASDFVEAGKNVPPSDPAGQALEISTEEKSVTAIIPGEQVPNNFQATEHSDCGPPFKHETDIKVTIDEQESSTQFEVSKLAFPTQACRETSSLKEDTTQSGLVLHKETRISLQIQKRPQESNQNERQPDDASDSFNQQTSTIPEFPTAAEFFALSTVANSTMSTSSKESNYMVSMPNSETPFQEFSYKPSSSSVTVTAFHNSSASSENYVYSMVSLKKILKKSLTEVARSTDAHHLLINLVNLKNSPILNSHQAEVIQDYIDNFDSLVANQPFYEQQIDMDISALVYSIEQKQRSIANLEALYQNSNIMSRTLSETMEAPKKMLHETETEEDGIRAIAEYIYADLVAKKRDLETDVSVLCKAKRRQQEAVEKARKASDSWEKLRDLFT